MPDALRVAVVQMSSQDVLADNLARVGHQHRADAQCAGVLDVLNAVDELVLALGARRDGLAGRGEREGAGAPGGMRAGEQAHLHRALAALRAALTKGEQFP